jgi:hypothetical protein
MARCRIAKPRLVACSAASRSDADLALATFVQLDVIGAVADSVDAAFTESKNIRILIDTVGGILPFWT